MNFCRLLVDEIFGFYKNGESENRALYREIENYYNKRKEIPFYDDIVTIIRRTSSNIDVETTGTSYNFLYSPLHISLKYLNVLLWEKTKYQKA